MRINRTVLFIFLVALLFLSIGVILLFHYGYSESANSLVLGFMLSAVLFSSGYYSIKWAFRRKGKLFYTIILGGMFFRLVIFITTLILITYVWHLPVVGFVGSFMMFYIIFQIFEIRFVKKELQNK